MEALQDLVDRTLLLYEDQILCSRFDPDWRSPCEVQQAGSLTYWRPVHQQQKVDFSRLENALEIPIHPDIQAFYQAFWSGTLETDSREGRVSLIQLWNTEDFDRLIANLIGHALNKQRTRSGFTAFFATTEPESELFLSIDNESGVILLEEPGQPPIREVEKDIATFLARLEPQRREPDLY